MRTTNQEKVSETKRHDVLKRGLAILLTISSLASCSPSPETPSGSTQTNSSSLSNNNFKLGGLRISLFGDARRTGNNEISASNGAVRLVRQDRSTEQSFIVRNKTHQVTITPRGTRGYVWITENVIDLACIEGKIAFQFPDIPEGKLGENQSVSSKDFKITRIDQYSLAQLWRIDECMDSKEECPDDDVPRRRGKPQKDKQSNWLEKASKGIEQVGKGIEQVGKDIEKARKDIEPDLALWLAQLEKGPKKGRPPVWEP